jgi:putative ABC transport system permease protein
MRVRHHRSTPEPRRQAWGSVWGLSRADLQHEWILTGCLIMAVAAVLSPLLLIFGLKYGTIETLRTRLVQDPRNREIRPLASQAFPHAWFARMQQRPDVAFLIPMTRQIAATITASLPPKPEGVTLNLIPTRAHDPLLLENAAPIPGAGECVLTHFAAEQLGAQLGDTVRVVATRIKSGHYETGTLEVRVVGVLSVRASALKSMYVPLEVLEAVERFKDGQAVPAFHWPGSTPTAYPRYNGLVVLLPQPLSPLEKLRLRHNTGFTHIEALTRKSLQAKTRWRLAADVAIYFLSTQKTPVGEESIDVVRHRLRGTGAILLPWIVPLRVQLLDDTGTGSSPLALYVLPDDRNQVAGLQFAPLPAWELATTARPIMLPAARTHASPEVSIRLSHDKSVLTFPVTPVAPHTLADDVAFIPIRLGSRLNLFRERHITYDATVDQFVLSRQGYAGFRLYARTIHDVDGLRRYFASQGLPVHTEAQRIQEVTDLDRYLTLLFWGIALVGIVGGAMALLASLYASVERKRRELGVLRLLGLSRRTLFRYPIYQGLMISAGGFAMALLFFTGMATAINWWFRDHLGPGESFCRIPAAYTAGAAGLTLFIATLAATSAAWRVTQIDPAEALRDE